MRIGVPDLVSNSYFPCVAAAVLGHYEREGVSLEFVHISPVEGCAAALAKGEIDFLGASAHAALTAFPNWQGAKLICSQSAGMYWFLVMRRQLGIARGDLAALKGKRIAAVPFVATALRKLLQAGGHDPAREGIDVFMPPSAMKPGVNFGVVAAEALANGEIDGFFANGMGAELAVTRGIGDIVLDIRRGDGPPEAFHYTRPAIATTDRMIADKPDAVAAVVRALVATQRALKADVSLAAEVGRKIFPAAEAALIRQVVARDLPYYDPAISAETAAAVNAYALSVGMQTSDRVRYEDIVATGLAPLWT